MAVIIEEFDEIEEFDNAPFPQTDYQITPRRPSMFDQIPQDHLLAEPAWEPPTTPSVPPEWPVLSPEENERMFQEDAALHSPWAGIVDVNLPEPEVRGLLTGMLKRAPYDFEVGATQSVLGTASSLSSPANVGMLVASLPLGGAPMAVRSAAALGFAGWAAANVPELSRQLGEEFGKPDAERDQAKISRLITDIGTQGGFAVLAGTPGAKGLIDAAKKKGVRPDASRIQETAEVHGDVRPQPVEVKAQVPVQESGAGVLPPEPARPGAGAGQAGDVPKIAAEPIVEPPMITEMAAKAMEQKVELPAQMDITRLQEQLNIFNEEIGSALESGGQFLPKELRPEVAKGAPAESGTVTSKAINQYFVNKLSTIRKQFNDARAKVAQQGDVEAGTYLDALQKRFENAFGQVQELRRASHESLYFWNEIKAEYQQIAQAAGVMPEIKRQIPILDQIWKDFRENKPLDAGKHLVDYLRMNLFTVGSWTLDFGTNLLVGASKLPAWAVMDAAHFVRGKPAEQVLSGLRALKLSGQNLIPFAKRFRLPEQIEAELGTTAGAEFAGRGKEVMVDFSEILKDNPALASKLKNADYVLGGPVRMKRAVDGFFGRLGAASDLYNHAYTEGRGRGLKGDELKAFVEEYVASPPQNAMESAIKVGKEFKFNRDLTAWEEKFASNTATKLLIESFPRWTMQFARWAGEMIGVNPSFFKKVVTGKATPAQTLEYLSEAATGWGGITMFNQLFYDNVDANTMEYVNENGDRTRLSGRTPAPELFFVSALLRGDTDKAKAALSHLSLPGAKLIGGEPSGILSPLIETMRESIRGRYTAEMTARELTQLANNAIPGKSMLSLARSIYDPTVREGFGAPIPGVGDLLPQRSNVTTGEPLAPKQRIPGTSIELPSVGGTPFPGAVRVLNDIEKVLMNHGFALTRPRRTSIIELPPEDVSKELRREYEVRVGKNIQRIVSEGVAMKEWQEASFDARREALRIWMESARAAARVELAEKYGSSAKPSKSVPLNIQRLPAKMKQ